MKPGVVTGGLVAYKGVVRLRLEPQVMPSGVACSHFALCKHQAECGVQDNGEWVSSEANFTSLATPNAIGSGKTALNTLLHEGAPPLHVSPLRLQMPTIYFMLQSLLLAAMRTELDFRQSCYQSRCHLPCCIHSSCSTRRKVAPLSTLRPASHAGSIDDLPLPQQQVQMNPCWGQLCCPHVLSSDTMCM